jgi:predicted RNase H-like nuclease (RuvC/YqgF family)
MTTKKEPGPGIEDSGPQITLSIDINQVKEMLGEKDMTILKLRSINSTLGAQLEEALSTIEILKKDIEKLQQNNARKLPKS